MSILEAALATHWAMEETALRQLLEIAAREHTVTPEALEAYRAKSLERAEAARVRDGVAIIEAYGPLVKRANLFDAMSGATSYEMMRRDLEAALTDRDVSAILLNVDSPGGEARAVGELAGAIYAARGRKPIFAYVGGTGASAAYWLASAASRVIVAPTAILGSIGVQVALRDRRAADEKAGVRTLNFISSQSPMKNADPATDVGAAALQATVDALAEVFVADVARNRGVEVGVVLERFGRGGLVVGAAAVAAGLADEIGTFEGALAMVAAEARKKSARGGGALAGSSGGASKKGFAMTPGFEALVQEIMRANAGPPPRVVTVVDEEAEIEAAVAAILSAGREPIGGNAFTAPPVAWLPPSSLPAASDTEIAEMVASIMGDGQPAKDFDPFAEVKALPEPKPAASAMSDAEAEALVAEIMAAGC
ncbi:S49 family peptidase [Teichococcus aestuarii]|uniref:Peptidase S49 domain-containing protein n=1 Tax=Teichococcus aestuarii TaxID=568898 RepID=A0A2U1UXJ8_9PROT|nr:S49 family peptidase [Pseudoroseomonas aestuarii]PWC26394.1 hypothetical protein CR165_23455 [Pseudoroseomonas aestuarii]